MYCRNCGSEVHEKAIACPKCGVPPLSEKKFCQECGSETKENQLICIKCGVKLINKRSGFSSGPDLNLDIQKLLHKLDFKIQILGLMISILMLISVFLPWYSARSSDWSISINALHSTWGIFAFIFTIVAILLSFIRFKWTLFVGILSFLFSLIFILDAPKVFGGIQGFDVHIGPYWGIFVFMILAVIYTLLNIKTFNEN
jgi:RNA polymerase subunit RPABC4/transcription elongation factor Spt4